MGGRAPSPAARAWACLQNGTATLSSAASNTTLQFIYSTAGNIAQGITISSTSPAVTINTAGNYEINAYCQFSSPGTAGNLAAGFAIDVVQNGSSIVNQQGHCHVVREDDAGWAIVITADSLAAGVPASNRTIYLPNQQAEYGNIAASVIANCGPETPSICRSRPLTPRAALAAA